MATKTLLPGWHLLLYNRKVQPGFLSLHRARAFLFLMVKRASHRLINRYAPTTTSRAAETATIASKRNANMGEIVANCPAAVCATTHRGANREPNMGEVTPVRVVFRCTRGSTRPARRSSCSSPRRQNTLLLRAPYPQDGPRTTGCDHSRSRRAWKSSSLRRNLSLAPHDVLLLRQVFQRKLLPTLFIGRS
jgi:hypothetical protein